MIPQIISERINAEALRRSPIYTEPEFLKFNLWADNDRDNFIQAAQYGYQLATDGREELEKERDELKANKQNYQETVLHHFEEIEALKKGLRKIEQMSDPGSPEAGIVYMKNIASKLLKQSP